MTFDNEGNISIELNETNTNVNKNYYISKELSEKNLQLTFLFAFASNSIVEIYTKDCDNGRFAGFEFEIYRDDLQNGIIGHYNCFGKN